MSNSLILGKSTTGKTLPAKITDTGELVVSGGSSFVIPSFDKQEFSYVGSTNNISTQVFKKGATTVATLTYTYVGSGAANNDKIASITLS